MVDGPLSPRQATMLKHIDRSLPVLAKYLEAQVGKGFVSESEAWDKVTLHGGYLVTSGCPAISGNLFA